jgi:hypothetical protein
MLTSTTLSEEAILHEAFIQLQNRLTKNYQNVFLNINAEKTVVIIPSLTLDKEILRAVKGIIHYEERMLCMLMQLSMPKTNVIYVTSTSIDNTIVDYYLHLLPGITGYHARQRLTLFSCYDTSAKSLTEKILSRPRLIKRIKDQIKYPENAHMACFNVTKHEQKLAQLLDIPIYGCNPNLLPLGTKTGCRLTYKKANVLIPHGYENLQTEEDIINAIILLKKEKQIVRKAIIKMNDGFSGEGNAVFNYDFLINEVLEVEVVKRVMHEQLKVVAPKVSIEQFLNKFYSMGGIVEEFIEGSEKYSPSVQCRINPVGGIDIISTHDQLLGGESEQVFIGAHFPASKEYSVEIATLAYKIAELMQADGVLGRFSIDFLSVKENNNWKHYTIETNLRKGGTTHPFMMLQYLTGGEYHWQNSTYITPSGQIRYYFASDNVINEKYKGLTPHDLIDIAMCNKLLFDVSTQCGVMFHMIGALSQYGKVGVVCIAKSKDEAIAYFNRTIQVLDAETA